MTELLTALLVVVTAFYAWVTYRILRANERVVEAMREQSEAAYRPYVTVSVFVEPDNPIFYLRISNTGRTSAEHLRLSLDQSFFQFGERSEDRNIANLAAFNETIDALGPGSSLTINLAQGFVVFGKTANPTTCPLRFTVTAKYAFGTKQVEERHAIDLRPYRGAAIPQEAIVRKLEAINDTLGKLAQSKEHAL